MGPSATDSGALAPRSGRLGGGGLGRWPRAACRSVGHGEFRPRRRCPTGTPPGPMAPMLRVWRTCRLEGVPETDSRGSRKAWDHLENARGIPSRTQCSGSGWALGGHPETSAHPHAEWMRFGEAGPFRAGDGLVGAKTRVPCGTGPAGDGETFPEVYPDWVRYAMVVHPRYSGGGLAGILRW